MTIFAEWLFILGLVAPPVAVVLAVIGVGVVSLFGRRAPTKPEARLRAA